MQISNNRIRSLEFQKTRKSKNKYYDLISKIIKLKHILHSNENSILAKSAEKLLGKKLYSLGLLESPNGLNFETITLKSFNKRKLKNLIYNKYSLKSLEDSLKIIKKKKIYFGSTVMFYPNLLISRELEKKINMIE
nr:hypothetical protein 1634Bnrm3_p151 [Cryptomonas sp.]